MTSNRKPINTIVFGNVAETFSTPLQAISNTQEGKLRLEHELYLSQRALFWAGDNALILTSIKLPNELIQSTAKSLKFEHITNLAPPREISLCSAIINGVLLPQVKELIEKAPGLELVTYSQTADFEKLVSILREQKLSFTLQHKCPQAVIAYLDSKSGFRQETSNIQNEVWKIPKGVLCWNMQTVLAEVHKEISNQNACVLKSNIGESGWGTLILKADRFRDKSQLDCEVRTVLETDPIWTFFPLIVEEFIKPDYKCCGGSPSVELTINENGPVVDYLCFQSIDDNGVFGGIILCAQLIPTHLKEQLELASMEIAWKYWELGYRGVFDIDFIITTNSKLFAIESNMRRTGGTHVFDIAKRIFTAPESYCLISKDSFEYSTNYVTANEILQILKQFQFPIGETNSGILLSLMNHSQSLLGYVVIAKDYVSAIRLQKQFENLLKC